MAKDTDQLLVEERDGILIATLNRPEKLNALTTMMLEALIEAVHRLRDDPDLKVMLIRATGRYFCSGADLRQGGGQTEATRSPVELRRRQRLQMGGMTALYDEMEQVEKPVVVAHQAMCLGGGLEMSLSCDFRLAAASAGYGFPEGKFGLLAAANGLSRFTRICGPHWARWMLLANKPISAEKAAAIGLVHEVYPDESFEEEVMAFCRHLASQSADQMAAAKIAIDIAFETGRDTARHLERLAHSSLILSGDQEGRLERYVEGIGQRSRD